MLGRSHFALGAVTGLAAGHVLHADPLATGAMTCVAAIGALLPDLDTQASALGSMLPRWWHELTPGHRRVTHSLVGLAGFAGFGWLLMAGLDGGRPASLLGVLAIALGVASHLVADGLTDEGVPLFWPARQHVGMPWPLAFATGTWREHVAVWASVLGAAAWVGWPLVGRWA